MRPTRGHPGEVKNKSPVGEKFTTREGLAEGVFTTEVLDTLAVEVEEAGGGGLVALGAAKSGGEEGDLHLLDLSIEVRAGVGKEDGLTRGEIGCE